jgi:nucleotide-binding universal stress UspA family protein
MSRLPIDGPVLVGTDDSARSRDAIVLGRVLADALRSQLLSVYVHHFEDVGALMSGGPATEARELIDEVAASKNRRAQALASAAGASPLPMSTAPTVAAGLRQLALDHRAALIVLGTRRSRSRFTLTPSTASRLLARRTHAVAIAPTDYRRSHDLDIVGCVLDGSAAARRVHQWAIAFAERSELDLRLIAGPRSRRAPACLLPQLEQSGDLDLLIIGSSGRSPVLPTFRSDLATALTRTAIRPSSFL